MQMNKKPLYGNYRGMPSQQQQQQQQQRYNKAPSKVVTIPVHFVGSERSRNDSAIKIQKVVRGFIVRSTMKRIMRISVEVEKVEEKVYNSLEVIKRDQKERLRVSETIMDLLLKLDSVRVLNFCYGVRECRKSVIRKAIALQEMVDHMVGSDEEPHHGDEGEGEESGCVGESQSEKMEQGVGVNLVDEESNCLVKEEFGCVGDSRGEKIEERGTNCLVKEEDQGCEGASEMLVAEPKDERSEGLRDEENKEEVKMEVEVKEESEGESVREESVGTSLVEENNCVVKEEEEEEEEEHGVEDGCVRRQGSHREMLERMMDDNEKMMAMMAQLFEKNEMQTRLLSSLSQRVEQLERAFACEKFRRCKRRTADSKQQKQPPSKRGSI